MPIKAIEWIDKKLKIVDQTKLPGELVYLSIDNYNDLAEAIKNLRIRGAPAIGIAAAFGVVLAAQNVPKGQRSEFFDEVEKAVQVIKETRPTAVNLIWALNRVRAVIGKNANRLLSEIADLMLKEAQAILREDEEMCRKIGEHGAELLPQNVSVLTHCNAGALATGGIGTALGVIYTAVEKGKSVKVYVDETRPLLQGARITAWELAQAGIDATLICDNMAAFVMQQGLVNCVLVGADRIARNGDVVNKIGTYNLALLARSHGIPFYVMAPYSTFDMSVASGEDIPIEERSKDEIITPFGRQIAPKDIKVYNPAFDMTPHELINAIVTEEGVIDQPNEENISRLKKNLIKT